jgi:hypothetical protein
MEQYAKLMNYQLSSLIIHKPKLCHVRICLCVDPTDEYTMKYIRWFQENTDLDMRVLELDEEQMSWRAMGRNIAASTTEADIVWFADIDQAYRETVLDQLATMKWPEGAVIVFPKYIQIHRKHRIGDRAIGRVKGPCIMDVDPDEFAVKVYSNAIGGTQIVTGDYARTEGYIPNHGKYQRPVPNPFHRRCRDDVAFRRLAVREGKVTRLDHLTGMYRLRHSKCGRMLGMKGN